MRNIIKKLNSLIGLTLLFLLIGCGGQLSNAPTSTDQTNNPIIGTTTNDVGNAGSFDPDPSNEDEPLQPGGGGTEVGNPTDTVVTPGDDPVDGDPEPLDPGIEDTSVITPEAPDSGGETGTEPETESFDPMDVNHDGAVNGGDYRKLINNLKSGCTPQVDEDCYGDLDEDGALTTADRDILLDYLESL